MGLKPAPPTYADEGVLLGRRSRLNVVGAGATLTDDAANDRLVLTVPGAAGGGRPVYNIADYGAVADWNGTTGTDNRAAIQAAINAAQSQYGGATVFIPRGYWRIAGALVISQAVNIIGEGGLSYSWQGNLVAGGSVLVNTQSSGNAITIRFASDPRPAAKMGTGTLIEGISIDSRIANPSFTVTSGIGGASQVDGTAIECADWASQVVISRCFIARHTTGINLGSNYNNYTADNEVQGCLVYMCRDYGIRQTRGIGNKIHGSAVRCVWSAEWAFSVTGSSQSTYGGGNGGYGIYFDYGDGFLLTDTEIISYDYGIYVGTCTHVKMSNVWADSCVNPFYVTSGGDFCTMDGCFATACTHTYLFNGTNIWVVGNYGFYIAASADGCAIRGCQCRRGSGAFLGAATIVTGNLFNNTEDAGTAAIQLAANGSVISGNMLGAFAQPGIRFNAAYEYQAAVTGNSISYLSLNGMTGSGLRLAGNLGV